VVPPDEHPLFRKKALEKLQSPEQLNMLMTVTSPQGWLALLALGVVLIAAATWAVFGTVQASVPGRGVLITKADDPNRLEAVLFVSMDDARRIEPEVSAKVSPITVRKEEYGYLIGEVLSVEAVPTSHADMLGILGTDSYVQSLAAAGELIQVRIELKRDNNPTSYQWTSADGPPSPLRPGTIVTGNVVVSEERPIELVFDDFKALFSGE
jgi:hypothetical protein